MSAADPVIVYLGLGSNIGKRAVALQTACDRIDALPGTRLVRLSPVYETDPWGYLAQDAFLNAVAELRTLLPAAALFQNVKEIERGMGRTPSERNHPRVIDIDMLLYGDLILDDPELRIPHPGIAGRRFVLQPLCDLAPDLEHPVLRVPMRALLERCDDAGAVRRFHR